MNHEVMNHDREKLREEALAEARAEINAAYTRGEIPYINTPEQFDVLGINFFGPVTSEDLKGMGERLRRVVLLVAQKGLAVNFGPGILGEESST